VSTAAVSWGLVADVHGNYPALEAALGILGAAGARRLAFLGDYLGRGDSDRCAARIREVADVAVVGNRDLDWQDRVSSATAAWVLSLPRTAAIGPLLVAHGDARLTPALSTGQIKRDFARTWAAMDQVHARVWAFGHSHHARVWRKASASQPAERVTPDLDVEIDSTHRYFVNVGTTGLPFPGKGGPSVALVDFHNRSIRLLPLDLNRILAE
jgi:predicted phosphodiesterase